MAIDYGQRSHLSLGPHRPLEGCVLVWSTWSFAAVLLDIPFAISSKTNLPDTVLFANVCEGKHRPAETDQGEGG